MIVEWQKLSFGSVKGEREQRRMDEGREREREREREWEREREREKVGKDLHMVSCWSPSLVTIDICGALLGLISRTQLGTGQQNSISTF